MTLREQFQKEIGNLFGFMPELWSREIMAAYSKNLILATLKGDKAYPDGLTGTYRAEMDEVFYTQVIARDGAK